MDPRVGHAGPAGKGGPLGASGFHPWPCGPILPARPPHTFAGGPMTESPALARPTGRAPVPWYLAGVTLASTCVIVGLLWDISWHRTIGRDAFLTPAHIAIYLGAVIAGLSCGALALLTTFGGNEAEKAVSVRFWGFRAPL